MKLLLKFCKIWAIGGVSILFLVVNMVSFNAILDLFLGYSFNGLSELLAPLVGIGIGMTLPYAEHKKAHLLVDLFSNHIPSPLKKKINYLANLFLVLILFILFYYTTLGLSQVKNDALLTPTLGLALWYSYLPLFISLFLWLILALHSLTSVKDD